MARSDESAAQQPTAVRSFFAGALISAPRFPRVCFVHNLTLSLHPRPLATAIVPSTRSATSSYMHRDGRHVTARFTLNAPCFLRTSSSVYACVCARARARLSLSITSQLARRQRKRDIGCALPEAPGLGVNVNP